MAQDRAHVHCDAKGNRIEIVMGASAIADREINGLRRRNTQASAKSVVRRQARPACCLEGLQKRRAVTSGRARSISNNPAAYRLRTHWRDIEARPPSDNPTTTTLHTSCAPLAAA